MSSMTLQQRGDSIRAIVADKNFDPIVDSARLRRVIDESFQVVPAASAEERAAQTTALLADIGGYGALQRLLDDPQIEEIYVNSPSKVFVARGGVSELTSIILDADEVKDLVERMLHHSGRRLDLSAPFVDAMLPGGERLHVVIPPVAGRDWALNVRKHLHQEFSLSKLVQLGSLPTGAARMLTTFMEAGFSAVVSGATQAGKTTFLRALAGAIPPRERVITCEEVFELNIRNRDSVAMQTRSANIEGRGEVTLRDLVRESLRMRPDRIVIGEVRGAEAFDMLLALNAGIPGLSTVHANSASEALSKLCLLPLLAGENVTSSFVVPTVARSIDLIIQVSRDSNGRRHVEEISYVSGRSEGAYIEADCLWRWDGTKLVPTGRAVEDPRLARVSMRESA
ncbi:CpaF family protein [Gleimia hominis]|uniref:CpaF family protein n=1 Tax=Gleimia hominis TaxID=595468 RepID=UPI000C7FDC45|nr:ATPase, T2SS/T4P/T4SS family [Gleimia hominis]WIK64741.1 ATPase, T2SS/T4P/T4SS family [Gleimia hominis]